MNCGKKIPDTLILVIYLPPAMLFFSFFKKIPDMLILVIYLPPAMLFLISQKIPDMLILVLYLPLTMPLWVVSKSLDTIFPHIVSAETTFFLHLEIQRSQYISPKVTVHKGAETIQGRKLFKGGNYMRKYGILILVHTAWHTERLHVFLFEPKRFLLTWEVKYAIGFNR